MMNPNISIEKSPWSDDLWDLYFDGRFVMCLGEYQLKALASDIEKALKELESRCAFYPCRHSETSALR